MDPNLFFAHALAAALGFTLGYLVGWVRNSLRCKAKRFGLHEWTDWKASSLYTGNDTRHCEICNFEELR